MGLAEELHRKHRERLARIEAAARLVKQTPDWPVQPVDPDQISPVPEPQRGSREWQARTEAAARRFASGSSDNVVVLPESLFWPEGKRLPATANNFAAIIRAVSKVTGLEVWRIQSWQRGKASSISEARHIIMWVMLVGIDQCRITWVGDYIGRHHSAVVKGYRSIEANKEALRPVLQRISAEIKVPLLRLSRQRTMSQLIAAAAAKSESKKSGVSDAAKNQSSDCG